jgi:hypothetical protein
VSCSQLSAVLDVGKPAVVVAIPVYVDDKPC